MVIVYIIAKKFNFTLMINFYHYCFCVASYSAENIIFIILPNRAHSNRLTIMAMNSKIKTLHLSHHTMYRSL